MLKRKERIEMNSIIQAYVEKRSINRQMRERLNKKINKNIAKIVGLQDRNKILYENLDEVGVVSWIHEVVKPLANELAQRLNKKLVLYGPFGMAGRVSIYLIDDETKGVFDQLALSITLDPTHLEQEGVVLYQTGRFPHETAPLPDNIVDIIKILKYLSPLPNNSEEITDFNKNCQKTI